MPERPPPDVAEEAAGHRAQALTPEVIDTVLADFRAWLEQAAAEGEVAPPPDDTERIDLHTLLAQFTALRHEVNLQTKAVRAQQEQNANTLEQLSDALEALREKASTGQDAEELTRAQLKTLTELHDALALAAREVQRVRDAVLPDLDRLAVPEPVPESRRSFWSRLFAPAVEAPRPRSDTADRVGRLLESVVTGYTMSLQRLDRALHQHGLEPIPATGRPFDPERMEALEVVSDSARPAGEVVEEVRRGYLWRGRVFRYAQVRVAKS